MFPTPAKVFGGVVISTVVVGVGACQSSPPAAAPPRVSPVLVLSPVRGGAETWSWERGRNDAAMGTLARRPVASEALIVERSTVRLRTTNGRPREYSQWSTRTIRASRIP